MDSLWPPQKWHGVLYAQRYNLRLISHLWQGKYPANAKVRPLTWFEKSCMTLIALLDCLLLGNSLRWIVFPNEPNKPEEDNCRRGFTDAYAMLGLGVLTVFVWREWTHPIVLAIAAYHIAEIIIATLMVQFVNVYKPGELVDSSQRGVILLLMGYVAVVFAFALFFKASDGVVKYHCEPIDDLGMLVYFSLMTITTVGYGDLHPATGSAAVWLVSLEVSIGILFVVVLLARFVGLARPDRRVETKRDGQGKNGDGGGDEAERVSAGWQKDEEVSMSDERVLFPARQAGSLHQPTLFRSSAEEFVAEVMVSEDEMRRWPTWMASCPAWRRCCGV